MIEYRALNASHLQDLLRVENECFPAPWTENMFLGALTSEFFFGFGAFDGERAVGFILGTVIFEDAEIDDVAVSAEYRRRGVGKQLLKKAEEEVKKRGATRAFLEVRSNNLPAMNLYEGGGYTAVRRRERYYPDGEDAFVMSKRL